jgi:6-pyruvoyltetrahydropterin/6-carboxytetrahydropterin synthase
MILTIKGIRLEAQFSIKVYKQYFNFAASHFMIFENGTREPLHGHNYRVMFRGVAPQLSGDMVFDFLDIKPIIRDLCNTLDHKLIIPKDHPLIRIDCSEKNTVITTPDECQFSIPTTDVLLLPILNSSAELIAVHISQEVRRIVFEKYQFKFSELEIEVEETPGQSAVYVYKEKEL